MCYTAVSGTELALKYAKHRGEDEVAKRLEAELKLLHVLREPKFMVSGFAHPKLLVFTNHEPMKPQEFIWGLIPFWAKDMADAKKAWNTTLNARGETIFEKASFKNSAKNKRCLIYLDAFYEHHHANKKTYPFRISMKDNSPMVMAGLWEEWIDKSTGEIYYTTSIVTTAGNNKMAFIHNNPKSELGPRMPVILPKEKQDEWLMDCKTDLDKQQLEALIKPIDQDLLEAYTVAPILGKNAIGNLPSVKEKYVYPELEMFIEF